MTIPEWDNVTVEIKGIGLADRQALVKASLDENGKQDNVKLFPALLIATVRDPDSHELVFASTDIEALGEKSQGVIGRVALKAMELLGLDEEGPEKNSEASPVVSPASE